MLGMHAMLLDPIHPQRLESAGTDVQRDLRGLDTACAQRFQKVAVEMQPRGRRSHRARPAREHRLIALAVGRRIRPRDIRRQRHVAVTFQQDERVFRGVEFQDEEFPFTPEHARLEGTLQVQTRPRLGRLARTHLGQQTVRVQHPFHQYFDATTAVFATVQARGNHPRIVQDQQIARTQQSAQVAESAIHDQALAIQTQQAARRAFRERFLGDQINGKIEGKIAALHGAAW
jgi:hypothetical protein